MLHATLHLPHMLYSMLQLQRGPGEALPEACSNILQEDEQQSV